MLAKSTPKFHMYERKRRAKPMRATTSELGDSGFAGFYSSTETCTKTERRTFKAQMGEEKPHVYCSKMVRPVQHTDKQGGKRFTQLPAQGEYHRPERRHVKPSREGDENLLMQSKTRVYSQKQPETLAINERSSTHSVESQLQRKVQKIDKRNGKPVKIKGDKKYSNPEFSDKFYAKEGNCLVRSDWKKNCQR